MTARVLYLSYDGMTDPLGRSQVLPYLTGLAALGHEITLVSFEKPGRSAEDRERVEAICGEAGIAWHPLRYHKRPPILSSVWDVIAMRLDHETSWTEVGELLTESYCMLAPKKLQVLVDRPEV